MHLSNEWGGSAPCWSLKITATDPTITIKYVMTTFCMMSACSPHGCINPWRDDAVPQHCLETWLNICNEVIAETRVGQVTAGWSRPRHVTEDIKCDHPWSTGIHTWNCEHSQAQINRFGGVGGVCLKWYVSFTHSFIAAGIFGVCSAHSLCSTPIWNFWNSELYGHFTQCSHFKATNCLKMYV